MYNLEEVTLKASRSNDVKNRRLHFFSSKFSIYFSWIFINLGISANGVTSIFFLTGLAGAILFSYENLVAVVIAYSLWRLHIIFDICDGEVARFTQKFSINGAYWDYMIHSIIYPITYSSICISLFYKFSDINFLIIAVFGSIVVSQLLAVKNNYYRAMLFNRLRLNIKQSESKRSHTNAFIINISSSLLNFEGFLFFYTLSKFFLIESSEYLLLLVFYSASFFLQSVVKFYLFSKYGFYQRKS